MRYLVQVFNESRAYCRAARKADAQESFNRLCREHPDAHIVFSETRKGVIAEQKPKEKECHPE